MLGLKTIYWSLNPLENKLSDNIFYDDTLFIHAQRMRVFQPMNLQHLTQSENLSFYLKKICV